MNQYNAPGRQITMKTLIIDDQPVCYELIKAMLKEYGICICAASGKEAARIYEESVISGSPFDLITLDISMPEMNGHKTIEAIREIERKNNITLHNEAVKIIMTTGMDELISRANL